MSERVKGQHQVVVLAAAVAGASRAAITSSPTRLTWVTRGVTVLFIAPFFVGAVDVVLRWRVSATSSLNADRRTYPTDAMYGRRRRERVSAARGTRRADTIPRREFASRVARVG
jgi:hypothetical protein